MSNFLYLDIETIETQNPTIRDSIAASVRPPASMSKPETIAKWEQEQKAQAVADAIAKTVFDGASGHVICIGSALGDSHPRAEIAEHVSEEAEILAKFFDGVKSRSVIVGHNVAWDIRFITQRAIIYGVTLPIWWPRDIKPWSQDIFCTMTAWAGVRDTISLDRLCRTLGITGKGDVTGADVGAMWKARHFEAIGRYCMSDVEKARAIHRKMMAAFGDIMPGKPVEVTGLDEDAAFLAGAA